MTLVVGGKSEVCGKLNDMKKLILPILILCNTVYGQITTTKVAPKAEQVDNTPYDSTKNFLAEKVQKYLGQELYLKGLSESIRKYGYSGFVIDYKEASLSNDKNIYKCCESYHSKYIELAEKYFTVLEVIKHPKATSGNSTDESLYGKKWFLKLKEKESNDIVYFEYSENYEHSFPFIVVGYFVKLKQTEINKEFIVRGKNWLTSGIMYDMNTGNAVSEFLPGNKWTCVDVTIDEKYYSLSLILQNQKGEQIPLSVDNSKRTNWVFNKDQAEIYKKIYGLENWNLILESKVKIGMTKEMCELSWGKPKSINETITSQNKSEQWVYSQGYLYFEKGVLTTIQ